MKMLLAFVMATLASVTAFGQGFPAVTIDGKSYAGIERVSLGGGGKIVIIYEGGGTTASADKVPAAFLKSWNITDHQREAAKKAETQKTADDLERAIKSGLFRELDGVVYDTRKPQSGWTSIRNARVVQVLEDGAILDLTPDSYEQHVAVFVKGLPPTISDTDFINLIAKLTGSYSYINKLKNDRTIKQYEVGTPCPRAEIPDAVLNGQKAFDLAINGRERGTDILATLPDNGELKGSGSGFFITEDGYFVTNFHVVEEGAKFKIKSPAGIFPATVIRRDKTRDLALLKVDGRFQPLIVAQDDAQLGDSVFTIGFPNIRLQGTQPKYTDGKVSSLAGLKDDPNQMQISVPVQPGNSDGPLVASDGSVAGIIVAQLSELAALRSTGTLPQNVNYAIKGRVLCEFLAAGPQINLGRQTTKIQSDAVVKSVEQSVALVMVY